MTRESPERRKKTKTNLDPNSVLTLPFGRSFSRSMLKKINNTGRETCVPEITIGGKCNDGVKMLKLRTGGVRRSGEAEEER